jgi:hypothetical protein
MFGAVDGVVIDHPAVVIAVVAAIDCGSDRIVALLFRFDFGSFLRGAFFAHLSTIGARRGLGKSDRIDVAPTPRLAVVNRNVKRNVK